MQQAFKRLFIALYNYFCIIAFSKGERMKNMTFLVSMQNADGIQVDFYRFSYKTAAAVKKSIKKALIDNFNFWDHFWNADGVKNIICYATPDGYNKGEIVWNYSSLEELYKDLGITN